MDNQRLWIAVVGAGVVGWLALAGVNAFIWSGTVGFNRGLSEQEVQERMQQPQYTLLKIIAITAGPALGFYLAKRITE